MCVSFILFLYCVIVDFIFRILLYYGKRVFMLFFKNFKKKEDFNLKSSYK
jgi:maltodextrin utilization protein YvdJ